MKKLKSLFALAAIFSLAMFTNSCADDDGDNTETSVDRPIIQLAGGSEFISEDTQVVVGSELKFSITAFENEDSKKNLDHLSITRIAGNDVEILLDSNISGTSFGPYEFEATASDTARQEVYEFVVTDRAEVSNEIRIVVDVQNEYQEFNGEFFHIASANLGAYDLVENAQRSSNESNDIKDMINNDEAATNQEDSKFTGSWMAENGSVFHQTTNANLYNNPSQQSLSTAWAVAGGDLTASSSVSSPEAGDFYIVNLRGTGEYAIIKVVAIQDVAKGNTGKIVFSYKKRMN